MSSGPRVVANLYTLRPPWATAPWAITVNTELVPAPTRVSHVKSHSPSKAPWTRYSAADSLTALEVNFPVSPAPPFSPLVHLGYFLANLSKLSIFFTQFFNNLPPPWKNNWNRPVSAPAAADLPTSRQSMPLGLRSPGFSAIWASCTARLCRASSNASVSTAVKGASCTRRWMIMNTASLLRALASAIWEMDVPPVIAASAARRASSMRSMTISAMISHFAAWILIEWFTWPWAISSSWSIIPSRWLTPPSFTSSDRPWT